MGGEEEEGKWGSFIPNGEWNPSEMITQTPAAD